MEARAGLCCGENDLRVGPSHSRAGERPTMTLDEVPSLGRGRARQTGKRREILGESLRQSRAQQQLADHYVGRAHALLSEKIDEPRVLLPEMAHPGVGVDEDHL